MCGSPIARAPQKVIAETCFVDRSRVSRWLKTARERGLLEDV